MADTPEYSYKQAGPPGMTVAEIQRKNREYWGGSHNKDQALDEGVPGLNAVSKVMGTAGKGAHVLAEGVNKVSENLTSQEDATDVGASSTVGGKTTGYQINTSSDRKR